MIFDETRDPIPDDLEARMVAQYPENFSACFDFSSPAGWDTLVEHLCHRVIALDPDIKIEQVKDKFGELRFYTSPTSTEVRELIDAAERESAHTCESCGAPGEHVNKGGWIITVCKNCWDKS